VWDEGEDEDQEYKVFKITVLKRGKKDSDGEECWSVRFDSGECYDYPESRIFLTESDAEKDMKSAVAEKKT
jgi:hypothetical protein